MSTDSKPVITFYLLNPDYLDDVTDVLEEGFPEVEFVRSENLAAADIVLADTVTPLKTEVKNNRRYVLFAEVDDLIPALNSRLKKGEVFIPTDISRSVLLGEIDDFSEHYKKLQDSTQLSLGSESLGELTEEHKASVLSLHAGQMSRFVPKIKRVLDRRIQRGYQRYIPTYGIIQPMISIEGYPEQSAYQADYSLDARVRMAILRREVEKSAEILASVGLEAPPTHMELSQINVGMPFFGGIERKAKGLSAPTRRFVELSEFLAEEMLHPAALAHAAADISGENVRVGVKSYAFQGAPLCSYSHATRQTAWSVMQRSSKGIFHFAGMHFPSVIGLRRQDNPSKKKRSSFLPTPRGTVARGRVYDGDELKGSSFPSITTFPSFSKEMVEDDGEWGARIRHVDNVSSLQNDALVPVPAYIAKWKDGHYKKLFQQDASIFASFIPGTTEFEEFWSEGWAHTPWVQRCAKERGISTLEDLLAKFKELGEYIFCGDVGNFDGNMTWELMSPGLKKLMSAEAFDLVEKMEKSSLIGAYTGADGEIVYYLVDKQDSKLGAETARLSSHLNSGLGITSQVGRITVPAMLLEIAENAFRIPRPILQAHPVVITLEDGSKERSRFSYMSAFLNSAGDDHSVVMLVNWLITGVHPETCRQKFKAAAEAYKVMEIAEETPPMNAGWLFHSDEKGRLINFSLSPKRMLSRNLAPERGRSAVGLHDSTSLYVESAIGTPAEGAMLVARDVIVENVFGFEDSDALFELREYEANALMNDPELATPAERLAVLLGVPVNSLEWMYSYEELVELGVPEDLLDEFKRPIPSDLTVGPFRFLNKQSVESLANQI